VALLALFAAYVTLINLQAQGAQGGIVRWFGGSPGATARILPGVLWRYLRLALLPYDPVFCVQPDVIPSWLDLRVWLPLVCLAGALLVAGRAIATDRRFALAVAWAVAMLAPVVQVVPMTTVYADRYLAMALPGLLVLVLEPASHLRFLELRPGARRAAALLVLLLLGGRSAGQARLWAHPEELFAQSVAAYPSSRHGWTGLGAERHQRGALADASEAYRRVLALDPTDGHVRYLLARVRLQQHAAPQALFQLEAALRDRPLHPDAAWMRAQIEQLRAQGVVPADEPE
jgi:tetratricopeptide (TPR) repeat protein